MHNTIAAVAALISFTGALLLSPSVLAQSTTTMADLPTNDSASKAVVVRQGTTELLRVNGNGATSIGGAPGSVGAYPMHLTVAGPSWTFLRLKAAGTPALAGILFDGAGPGYYTGFNNSGALRLAPMSEVSESALTAAKDTYSGLTLDTNGNLGIGTLPESIGGYSMPLTVTAVSWPYLRLKGSGTPAQTGIVFDRTGSTTGFLAAFSSSGSLRIAPIATMNEAGITAAKDGSTGLTLDAAGNLNVSGDITGARVINAVYQDLAEWVPSAENLDAGTVVVLDRSDSNRVAASSSSYDTAVAGVVSAQPGILLGQPGASKEQVATTGRVRVKVDAGRSGIAVGDLLVTSDRRGYAMRSEAIEIAGRRIHQPGTIIGKALEPLAGGTGEILVLLSLQ